MKVEIWFSDVYSNSTVECSEEIGKSMGQNCSS